MCLQILSHEKECYQLYHVIYNKTKHYASRCLTQINKLEEQLTKLHELEEAILIKETAIEKLTKLRHHYTLVVDGMTYSIDNMSKQVEVMREKIESLK